MKARGLRDALRAALPMAWLATALCIAPLAAPGAEAAEPPGAMVAATVDQPRAFGHVLGDVLTQRVLLEHEGRSLQPQALPTAGRVDLWLERGPARIETAAQGRRWLVIDYQITNAPRELKSIALPALNIGTASGPTLAVGAWPVSVAALTPQEVLGQGDLQLLRPDRPVAALTTGAIERQLGLSLMALLGVLLVWTGWWVWRNALEARRLPFARAWHQLRRIDDPDSAQAWRIVHRALNTSAGHVVYGADLARLMSQAPYLLPLRAQLEDFYRESTKRFFAADSADGAAKGEGPRYPLQALCRALRDAEKRLRR
jgi:mxaA protein